MKRTIVIIVFLLGLNGYIWAQKERRLVYESAFGTSITMNDSAFVVLSYKRDFPNTIKMRTCDTIAVCSWRKISDDIIRIDSRNPYGLVRESSSIVLKNEPSIHNDSLSLSFSLPVETTPIEIRLCQLMDNNILFEKRIDYPHEKSAKVPFGITYVFINTSRFLIEESNPSFFLEIEPPYRRPIFHLPFFVLNNLNSIESKEVEISIPVMNDAFFERLWVEGEYIQICEKGLLWHGILFYKPQESGSIFKMPGQIINGPRPSIIERTKITDEQYTSFVQALDKLDEYGR